MVAAIRAITASKRVNFIIDELTEFIDFSSKLERRE